VPDPIFYLIEWLQDSAISHTGGDHRVDGWHWALVAVGAVSLVVAGLAAVLAFRGQSKIEKMKSTKTISTAEAAAAATPGAGVTVELYGKAEVAEPLVAPGTGTRCVYFQHKIEQLFEELHYGGGYDSIRGGYNDVNRTTHEWRTVSDNKQYLPFLLRDSSGAIQVDPRDAEIVAKETLSNAPQGVQEHSDGGGGIMEAAKNLTVGAFSMQTGQRRQSEWVVATGVPIYVLGAAVVTPQGPVVEKGEDPFIVSWKAEEELTKHISWRLAGWLVGASAAIVLGALVIFYGFTNKTWFKTGGSPVGLIIAGAVVLAGLGFAIFNFMPSRQGRMQMGIPGGDPVSAQVWGGQGAPPMQGFEQAPLTPCAAAAEAGLIKCPSCEMPIQPGIAKCPHCHWNIGPGGATGTPYTARSVSPTDSGAGAVLGMAVLGGAAAGGLIGSAMSNPQVDGMLEIKDKINCPNCNLELAPTIEKCPGCGTDLTRRAAMVQPGSSSVPAAPAEGGPQAPMAQAPSSSVPAAPAEGGPQAQAAAPGPQVPAAPADPDIRLGVVQRDVVIGGVVAFKQGERVVVEAESPDPQRPEYRYVVLSRSLNKKFRLSDLDLFV
jgi:hypothetical protein